MPLLPSSTFFAAPPGSGSAIVVTGEPMANVSASTGREDGAVKLLSRYHAAGSRHGTTVELADKMIDFKRGFDVIGHGDLGSFETGDGQWGLTYEGTVASWSRSNWEEPLSRLKGVVAETRNRLGWLYRSPPTLTIWACSTAQGPHGEEFIASLQEITERQIRVPTGLLYINRERWWIERGCRMKTFPLPGEWGRIDGTTEGAADIMDSSELTNAEGAESLPLRDTNAELFELNGDFVDANNVEAVLIKSTRDGRPYETEVRGADAEALIDKVFHTENFEKNGFAPGKVTDSITIHYVDRQPVELSVFSRKLVEVTGSKISCLASTELDSAISAIHGIP